MADLAHEFLATWTVERAAPEPLSPADAAMMADRWRADGEDNGVDPAALDAAAGGDLAAYLLRTFGDSGAGFVVD